MVEILAEIVTVDAGVRGAVRARGAGAARRGHGPPAGARATRSSGSAPRGRRRSTPATSAPRSSTGWPSAGGMLTAAGSGRVRGRRPRAGRGSLPRPRGADEPAAVGGRDPDRARALAARRRQPGRPSVERIVEVMERDPGRAHARVPGGPRRPGVRRARSWRPQAGPLGSTTHIAVLDRDGWACSVTCSNGSCSGVVVPGTGRPPQQHARRAGPQPARASTATRPGGGCRA